MLTNQYDVTIIASNNILATMAFFHYYYYYYYRLGWVPKQNLWRLMQTGCPSCRQPTALKEHVATSASQHKSDCNFNNENSCILQSKNDFSLDFLQKYTKFGWQRILTYCRAQLNNHIKILTTSNL